MPRYALVVLLKLACAWASPSCTVSMKGRAVVPKPPLSGCGAYYSPNSSATCCDKNKTDVLNQNFREAVQPFLGACGSCVRNLEALWCTYSCAPRQSDWAANATHLVIDEDYNDALYESCRDVAFRKVHEGVKYPCWGANPGLIVGCPSPLHLLALVALTSPWLDPHRENRVGAVYPTARNFTRHMMGFESHIAVQFVRGEGQLAFSAPLQRCQDDCACDQCRAACPAMANKPHLIFVLADDLGFNNVGWHGSAVYKTPHLDELAASGVRLEAHYVQRWCAPSRASLLTGRYAFHTGMNEYNQHVNGTKVAEERSAVPASFDLLPKMLAPAGYVSHMLGKWHLGFFSPAHMPTGRGFASSFGYLLGQESHDNRSSQISHTCEVPVKDLHNGTRPANESGGWAFNDVYSAEMYGVLAPRLIELHDESKPLFLYMAFQNCHAPQQAPPAYLARFSSLPGGPDGSRRCFAAMTSALDDAIGNITSALRSRPAMYANSITVFTSDNGGPAREANNWPLRGSKFSTFEGGVRSAAFIHSPLLPAARRGRIYSGLLHLSDWYSTFAALAGVNLSAASTGPVPPDGFDVWPAIANNATSPRHSIVHELDHISRIYAYRSGRYKLSWGNLCHSHHDNCVAAQDLDYKGHGCVTLAPPHSYRKGNDWGDHDDDYVGRWPSEDREDRDPTPCTERKPCLYDIEADPLERTNLALQQQHQGLVADLKAELAAVGARSMPVSLDRAVTSEDAYCEWVQRVGWVQPFEGGHEIAM